MTKLFKVTIICFFLFFYKSYSQIGIGTTQPEESSILDINSDDKGLLIPRIETNNLPSSPAKGLIVFNTTENCIQQNMGTPSSPKWECLTSKEESTVKSFYPPAYALEITTTGSGAFDIYNHYSTTYSNAGSAGITVYPSSSLDYVVLNYDNSVFSSVTINSSGVMTYNVTALPTSNKSIINVLFVIK